MLDLPTLLPLLGSLLGALGVGSLIVQWAAGGKDRRAARAAALDALAAAESARWLTDEPGETEQSSGEKVRAAVRKLETAALVARIPRAAVRPYVCMAVAAIWTQNEDVERYGEPRGLDVPTARAITAAAEIVSRAAWSSPVSRLFWLRWGLRRLRRQVAALDDPTFTRRLDNARNALP